MLYHTYLLEQATEAFYEYVLHGICEEETSL